jgi:hypothetical protein
MTALGPRAEASEDGCQVLIVSIRDINLQCLDIQPTMPADSKKTVISRIIIALIIVSHSSCVKSEYRMHSKAKQPGVFLKYKIKVPDPFHELSFFPDIVKNDRDSYPAGAFSVLIYRCTSWRVRILVSA